MNWRSGRPARRPSEMNQESLPQRLLRGARHLASGPWVVRNHFPSGALDRIEAVVADGEQKHSAEIRIVIEGSLSFSEVVWQNRQPRERALDLFADLHVWDTESNNGILIYLLLADRDVELVADRGANSSLPSGIWDQAVAIVRESCQAGKFESGVVNAVQFLNEALVSAFPAEGRNPDELPNRPAVI